MYNPIDRNNPFDEHIPTFDMDLLQKLIGQQSRHRQTFENIAILGCGYVGGTLADHWQDRGHFVTGTTTSKHRVAALAQTGPPIEILPSPFIRMFCVKALLLP